MATGRTPGQRAGLTPELVREAALDLMKTGGADGLTMRALGARLGVAPNALYSHVEDKLALIDGILDDLLADVEVPPHGGSPIAGLETIMVSTYGVLTSHPHIVPLYVDRRGARGDNARRLGEQMLGLLAEIGLNDHESVQARHVLIVYTIGAAAYAAAAPLAQHYVADPRSLDGSAETFRSGLRWLLAGINPTG